jgi:hypothetical protein
MKSVNDIVERYFQLELLLQGAKGTMRYNDIAVERQALAWVLDYQYK